MKKEIMMVYFTEMISQDGIFLLRLLTAMVLGGVIGMERQVRGREAGLRTNILVCLGSAVIIVAFQKLSLEFNMGAESAIRMDPARAAAGVITGIGFLGAGTIVKNKDFVRGLTTAASIWVVSAIGVTVGLGEYVIAVTLTLLVLVALYALHSLRINGDYYRSLQLKWIGDLKLLAEVTDQLHHEGVKIKSHSIISQPKTGNCRVTLYLLMRKKDQAKVVLDQLHTDVRFDEVSLY